MIDTVFAFISQYQFLIAIFCMLIFYLGTWAITGQYKLGIVAMELVNCWNLTIYLTGWLTPELKPFMPLWVSLMILVLPFLIILVPPNIKVKQKEIK